MTKNDVETIRFAIEAAILAALEDVQRRFGPKAMGPTLPFSKEEKLNDELIFVSRVAGDAAAETLKKIRVTG